jgi:SpoVK/Ycf46/Vps4 family AAA+-type ATPase
MFIGDGAKLIRDAFELAKEKAPAIIFIDELDAIGTKRFDSDKSGDREVQRTMLELLNQLDGFSSDERIKVSVLAFPVRLARRTPADPGDPRIGHRGDESNRYPRPGSAPIRSVGSKDRVPLAQRRSPSEDHADPREEDDGQSESQL